MPKKMSDYDRGVIIGIGLACAIAQGNHDQPGMLSEVLEACGLNRGKLKRAGLEQCDLDALRPVFRDMRR